MFLIFPIMVAFGAVVALVLSLVVGVVQSDRRAGFARASRLIAMAATCVPVVLVACSYLYGPDYLTGAFGFLPYIVGCWLVAVFFERCNRGGSSSEMGLNPDRSGY